jgi:lipoprotein-anchoring transpeptidase ErfK/SrfK
MNRKILIIASIVCLAGAAVFFLYPKKEVDTVTTVLPPVATIPPKPRLSLTYHFLLLQSALPLEELQKAVGKDNVELVLNLNRIDEKHVKQGATLTVPDSFADRDSLSPFPAVLPSAQNIAKLLLISQEMQAFGAYEYGRLVRWNSVSTGKQSTPTPSKLFSLNWKGKLVTSSISDEWILPWYFNLDNFDGISIHQYEMPGYPASHSCVRLFEKDAMWLYDWGEQWILTPDGTERLAHGTPVIVFGSYDYKAQAPWKVLPTNPKATTLTSEELDAIVSSNLETIESRAQKRDSLTNKASPAETLE